MTAGLGRARHVWLVGMPGAGKSAAGRALAEQLGLAFVDLDDEVERAAGRPVGDIFSSDGEAGFRSLESAALCAAADGPPAVVATGGGAVIAEENRRAMRRTGLVVQIRVPAELAVERLAGSPTVRPLLAEPGAWARLAEEREPLYREVADAVVDGAAGGPEEGDTSARVAEAVAAAVSGAPELLEDVRVEARGGTYDVTVAAGILGGRLRLWLPAAPSEGAVFVLSDPAVSGQYLDPVAAAAEEAGWRTVHMPVPEGETAKTLAVAEALYRQLAVREAQRDDLILALGGGATGDLAGFVAATYLRGMRVVQLPTTLLAMVDAAIGGKTGVNLSAGKNLVGAFHQPVAVVADVSTLATLPDAEFRSGLGEVAKYALAFDRGLVALLERETGRLAGDDSRGEDALLHEIVVRCVRIKAEVVSKDERDDAERLFLNYGHTLGHALERLSEFRGRSHGEAVSIGCVFAARLAERLGVAEPGLVERHVRLLEPLGLPTGGPLPPPAEILQAMRMDKKRRGALRFVLLEDIGRPTVVTDVPDEVVIEMLEAM